MQPSCLLIVLPSSLPTSVPGLVYLPSPPPSLFSALSHHPLHPLHLCPSRYASFRSTGPATSQLVESTLEELAAGTGGRLKVVRGTAVGLDLKDRVIQLEGGGALRYDKLCLCTGARPQELQVHGADHPAVMTLRDTDSVQELSRRLRSCRRLLLVGNGGIALELAGELLQLRSRAPTSRPPGGAPTTSAPMDPTMENTGVQPPELVWVLKHGHVGDAFFDLDAAQFLLHERLQVPVDEEAGVPVPLPQAPAQPGSTPSITTAATSDIVPAVICGSGHPEQQLKGEAGCRVGRGLHGHAAGPAWTQELLRGLVMAHDEQQSMAVSAERIRDEGAGTSGGVNVSGGADLRRQGDPAQAAATGGGGAAGWGARGFQNFRLVLEFSCTVTRIGAGGANAPSSPDSAPWPLYVTLSNGKVYDADLVVCGIGVIPATEWLPPSLARAPDGGVVVDQYMRTSDPHVFAAGDCCTADWPEGSPHWFQMRLWTQARVMGTFAAHSMLGRADELASGFNFELFTHVTRFLGAKVVFLGLYNGQRLGHEPVQDIQLFSRVAQAVDGSGSTFVRVLMLRGRMQGAVLIGETELEEVSGE
ncbi:hypothetical protein Vretifemale_3287 [Volvox reticuliferus]|uniref:FAD/NAD(P)-binding domain-containing protein n=1 Tax=Volvox reticuliferus TaxID=1737510 RepID=A0A8J4C094_9CHLO|nr:hypothetical protein Vretifemale_3287 [Volvox reticuliferus]